MPSNQRAPELALSLRAFRFHYRALSQIYFPPGKAANTLRGALGTALGAMESKAGSALFSPLVMAGPSGFLNPPRPFILRTQALEAGSPTHNAGSVFFFDLHLFQLDPAAIRSVAAAFERYSVIGIGPAKGQIQLASISAINADRTEGDVLWNESPAAGDPLHLTLVADEAAPVARLRLNFTTPTELKHESSPATRPEFGILFGRLRDRISSLQTFYGPAPLEMDFQSLAERAREVQLVEFTLDHHSVIRRSSRTGQRHPIGGFTGTAVYQGPLTEFVPWLRAGYRTGVGRKTVWGKGVIEIVEAV